MTIEVQCACGARYRVAADSAGRKVKCRHCQAVLSVRAAESSPVTAETPGPVPRHTPTAEPEESGKKAKAAKRLRKKARADKYANAFGSTLEERLARTDEDAFRPAEVQRGLRYLAYGLCIMVIGGMLTYLLAELAKDKSDLERNYGLLSIMYKIGGVWGPLIVCTIGGLIPCVLGILNLMGIGIVVWENDSQLWGTRSGGSKSRRKGKSGVRSNKGVYIGLAGVTGVLVIGMVIFLATRSRRDQPEPQAANPNPTPADNKPPVGDNKPPAPIELPAEWTLRPDPLSAPAAPWNLPEVVRIGISGKPTLAASNGPFLLTVPPPRGGEGEVWDMRKAQPAGKLSVKAYLHGLTRLSADGQAVATLLAERAGGSSFVTIWKPGQAFATAQLNIPGWVMWLDFGASADELLILTRTETKDPKDAQDHLQQWSVSKRKAERKFELPEAARPPRSTKLALIPASRSPGGKYFALLADKKVAILATSDGRHVAQRLLTNPGDLIQGGLWFSDDGAELTGIFKSYRGTQFLASRFQGWKMADGKPFADAVIAQDVLGPPIPGPEPGTVFLTATVLNAGKSIRQGHVMDLKSGAQIFVQPLFVPMRWLPDGRLLGYRMADKTNQPRFVEPIVFDRAKFKAEAGPNQVSPDP